ncbi:MAG: PfkB family carbohydrate kinase [Halothermotrichaceae bacterium]
MSLICVGDNVADYYHQKNKFYPGGSAYNVAVLAGRLGMETAYIGAFGTDIAGKYLVNVLKKEGINTSHIDIKDGKNAYSHIIVENGEGKVEKVDKGVYEKFTLTEGDLQYISQFQYLHTTVYSYTEKYLQCFKESGVVVSFDYSFKSAFNYLEETAPYVDIAFFSKDMISDDTKSFMSSVSQAGPDYVIVTLGREGVMALYQQEFYHQSVREVEVVDTLGAGDNFIAMFIYCLANGVSLPETLKKSTVIAAESCKNYGAIGRGKIF